MVSLNVADVIDRVANGREWAGSAVGARSPLALVLVDSTTEHTADPSGHLDWGSWGVGRVGVSFRRGWLR